MMSNVSSIFLLISLMILASCSGGKGSARLEVSRGFVVAGDFDGGIIIHGKNIAGTYTFQAGITSGNTTNVNIPFDTYDIKIVGWHSGTTPSAYQGTTYCGRTNFAFTTAGQSLSVVLDLATCSHSDFADASYKMSSAGTTIFKNFALATCGALYDPTGDPTGYKSAAANAYDTCANYPDDIKGLKIGYYKIVYQNIAPPAPISTGIASACLSAQSGTQKKLPSKMPFRFDLYKDNACTTLVKSFDFPGGPQTTNPAFDSYLGYDSSQQYLRLPSATHNRGFAGFTSETPEFKCNNTSLSRCSNILDPTSGNTPYALDVGYYQRIKLPGKTTYPCTTFTPLTGSITMESGTCVVHNGNTYIRVKSLTGGASSFSYAGTTYNVTFGNSASVLNGAQNSRLRKTYQTLKTLLGYEYAPGQHDLALQDDFLNDGKNYYGVLSKVRDILSPYGAGGLFTEQNCTSTPLGSPITRSMVKYNPDGTTDSLEITLSNPPAVAVPNYLANNSLGPQATAPDSGVAYERRFVIRKLKTPPALFETVQILDVDCDSSTTTQANFSLNSDKRIGRLEEHLHHNEGTDNVYTMNLLHYNVTREVNGRFDLYTDMKRNDSSGTLQNRVRAFYRAEKFPDANDQSAYRISAVTYEVQRDGSAYDETLKRFEIDAQWGQPGNSTAMTYSYKDMGTLGNDDETVGDIFTDPNFHKQKNEVIFDYQFGLERRNQSSLTSRPDGKFIQALKSGTTLNALAYNGLNYIPLTATGVDPLFIASDISDNGSYGVVASYLANNTIRVDRFTSGAWQTPLTMTISDTPIKELQVAIINNGDYLVTAISNGSFDNLFHIYRQFSDTGTSMINNQGGTDETLSHSLVRTSTNFYIVYSMIEQMGGDAMLAYCHYDIMTPECVHTAFNPTITSSNLSATYSDVEAFIAPGTSDLYVTSKNDDTGDTHTVYAPIGTLPNQVESIISGSDAFNPRWDSNSYTSNYSTQLLWNASWAGHAYVPTPFIQPVLNSTHGFQMNWMSLKQSNMDSLYTPHATFINITN